MIDVNYIKKKNIELFKTLERKDYLNVSSCQNYIPIYNNFFSLNESNFNSINLNHKWHISNLISKDSTSLYSCKLKNCLNQKTKVKNVFFKMAPLLDPFKYLVGKYKIDDDLFNLPTLDNENVHEKIKSTNNSAYIDGLFAYLNNILYSEYKVLNALEYYGSFLSIKEDFKLDVYDDLDYLHDSDFFKKQENNLYSINRYNHLFAKEEKIKPIKISNDSLKSNLSYESIEKLEFDNLFNDNDTNEELKEELEEFCDSNLVLKSSISLKSSSTCSSRSSHTSNDSVSEYTSGSDDSNESSGSESESDDEILYATIKRFPIQLIALEKCEKTLDDLIIDEEIDDDEMIAFLMQIIMTLIIFQKAFSFTHNDLHTNNIMFVNTDKKFLYYQFNNITYKIPTFGKLFKIIDFGRGIFKLKGKIFCSDSFKPGEDAATQYNTEPYFNDQKPRLEPNFSFDLCRLGCSIFDYMIEESDDINNLTSLSPLKKLIVEWCLDDNGINLLYKSNGSDRYPDFKLYKMIARYVHNHTPQKQLSKEIFKQFEFKIVNSISDLINIDDLPSFIN